MSIVVRTKPPEGMRWALDYEAFEEARVAIIQAAARQAREANRRDLGKAMLRLVEDRLSYSSAPEKFEEVPE